MRWVYKLMWWRDRLYELMQCNSGMEKADLMHGSRLRAYELMWLMHGGNVWKVDKLIHCGVGNELMHGVVVRD